MRPRGRGAGGLDPEALERRVDGVGERLRRLAAVERRPRVADFIYRRLRDAVRRQPESDDVRRV